jgi:UDP-3-O-[3-hydroxymyristoyl] N-acetylglucosamine deacetylase
MKARTIKRAITFKGIGLHSGDPIELRLSPRKSGGIFFKNEQNQTLEALFSNVVDTQLGTTIGGNGAVFKTIEHLMAAIYATGIDTVTIKLTGGQEIPILDGSAQRFIDKIENTGLTELKNNRKYLKILKKVEYVEEDKFIKIAPADDFSIDMTVDFLYGSIGKQHLQWKGQKSIFPARTFCQQKEIDYMLSIGLAKGGTLDNAMVFNDTGLVNEGGFRMENEVVNHKVLDCIGDMYTSGYHILGAITANKTGHSLNNKLLKKIFEDRSNYSVIE